MVLKWVEWIFSQAQICPLLIKNRSPLETRNSQSGIPGLGKGYECNHLFLHKDPG